MTSFETKRRKHHPRKSPTMSAAIQYSFVLVDHTTSATPASLKPATSFGFMIEAWLEQIEGPFSAAYGEQCVSFRIAAGVNDRAPTEVGIHFRDQIPEAPGALAYHQVVNGVPDIELGVDLFMTLTVGLESVSSGGSHELLELLGDPGANQWADRQDGSAEMDAKEMCDFVQNTGYAATNGVWVSNFVLPSVWIPGATGPYDHMGVMQSQYDVSSGYGIQGEAPANITQIGGRAKIGENTHQGRKVFIVGPPLSPTQRKLKESPYSRTYRRGVRLKGPPPVQMQAPSPKVVVP